MWCWEQGEVRLVMPSSYYYRYCMNGGGHIDSRPTTLNSLYILGCTNVLVLYIFRLTGNPAT